LQDGDIEMNNFRDRFLTIGQAKVSTSAYEAFEFGYLKKGRDVVVVSQNRLLAEAKQHCLQPWPMRATYSLSRVLISEY
jgi:3-hydroxyacyl-CoA dehydrogenase